MCRVVKRCEAFDGSGSIRTGRQAHLAQSPTRIPYCSGSKDSRERGHRQFQHEGDNDLGRIND